MEKKIEKSLVDTFSPATRYESLMVELGGEGNTEEKTLLVFRVMDRLIPELGVFTEIMKMCRDQLFDAVYSDQYTGASEGEAKQYIQKVPYFTLIKRVHDERDEKAEQLSEKLDLVKKKLFDKQRQFEDAEDTIADLRSEIEANNESIRNLEMDLEVQEKDMEGLKESLEELRQRAEETEYQLNCDISDLKEELQDAKSENNFLSHYKQGYDDLESAFEQQPGIEDLMLRQKKKRGAVATKRAHLISSITSAMKLEEQMLTVQNALLEEFDKFMEEHKEELCQEGDDLDDSARDYYQDDMEIDRADQQLMVMQERFKKNIDDINLELELLRQQKSLLQEQLQILEENAPATKKKKKKEQRDALGGQGGSRPNTRESGLSQGLEEEEENDPAMDPFIPQEKVFSKYAVMLYSSDNTGKTFQEFKDAKYCASCGEKTVICPHKILKSDHVFTLPPRAVYLKVTRPKVKINQEAMDRIFRPNTRGLGLDYPSPVTRKPGSSASMMVQGVSPMFNQSSTKSPTDSMSTFSALGGGETQTVYTIARLWDDYKARTSLERTVPRPLSLERTLSLIEQFSAYMIWQDEYAIEEDGYFTVLDSLYNFLRSRYIKEDITFLAAQDFLVGLTEHSNSNKIIQLFTNVLIGNFDACVFRYVLLVGDIVDQIDWIEVADFRNFASAFYPFATEDDLENLQMGYTSFSENKISKQLVVEYIIYIISKYREPRFLESEMKLLNHPGKQANCLSEQEFAETIDSVLSVVNDRFRKRLYREAELYVQTKDNFTTGVPILRLAQITSFLEMEQILSVVMDAAIEKTLTQKDMGSSVKTGSTKSPHSTAHNESILTMSQARILANNLARRERCRQRRIEQDF